MVWATASRGLPGHPFPSVMLLSSCYIHYPYEFQWTRVGEGKYDFQPFRNMNIDRMSPWLIKQMLVFLFVTPLPVLLQQFEIAVSGYALQLPEQKDVGEWWAVSGGVETKNSLCPTCFLPGPYLKSVIFNLWSRSPSRTLIVLLKVLQLCPSAFESLGCLDMPDLPNTKWTYDSISTVMWQQGLLWRHNKMFSNHMLPLQTV